MSFLNHPYHLRLPRNKGLDYCCKVGSLYPIIVVLLKLELRGLCGLRPPKMGASVVHGREQDQRMGCFRY